MVGQSAPAFHLQQSQIADFKALLRTVTSGRVLLISTRFRSDLFYSTVQSKNSAILKLWALYTNAALTALASKDICACVGPNDSLACYFEAIQAFSSHRYRYKQYKAAFAHTYQHDQHNPVARTVIQCDQYLTQRPDICRSPLIDLDRALPEPVQKDTFALAMRLLQSGTCEN